MNGLLDDRIMVLHPQRRTVETGLAKRVQMSPRHAARIDFHSAFDIARHLKLRMDHPAQRADFLRCQKSGRAAAEVKLDGFAFWVKQPPHDAEFALQVIEISGAGALI